MAKTNKDRLTAALDLLRQGLGPFVEREFENVHGKRSEDIARSYFPDDRNLSRKPISQWDVSPLLKLMWDSWNDVFGKTLGRAERSLITELRDARNNWAHQASFSSDDTDRALDSIARLLAAVSAPEGEEVTKMKLDLRRLMFDEQVRGEKRKAGGSLIETQASGSLKPWREVVTPHPDVASGRYQQAEFAADLWQVHIGEGSDEYRKPQEFFRRTFLTESLKRLLIGAVQRVSGKGGDPVVQLQTNFGGGKTHSMLALYHLLSGTKPSELTGVDTVMAEANVSELPVVKRVVLVGNKISPGNPITKKDGTVVRTLWGELAYQLGGKKAFARIKEDDEKATSPGDTLRELFKEYGPCLILVDEWVAYARQLHEESDLPGGSFETQFSFAQALTESAKLAGNCLLVISLPASDTAGSPHTQADDVEVGGIRGRTALDRLRNVVGRLESSWRPATAEEGFEIVRRRLFEPLPGPEAFKSRDVTARAFGDLYRAQAAEFPQECKNADYERRMQAAYPIHPEIFDQLYGTWSTLVKFQRTRGVLRLMASVIHSLWEKGDKNPLILPSTIPIDDPRVQFELTRYLSDVWVPIMEKDVDGPNSMPLKIDAQQPNLGVLHATRRVARTIYLGSAPTADAAHRGIEDRQIKLGCVMPGESVQVFGDALRRLAANTTYLYQDGPRYWYSTQPTVSKLAEDRAEQYKRDADKLHEELERRVRIEAKKSPEIGVHVFPASGADVPDQFETRLVILPREAPHGKDGVSDAEKTAKAILESRGNSPRLYRNTLVFLAADRVRLQDLDDAMSKFVAWDSIVAEKLTLNLDPHQARQAEQQRKAADDTVNQRLPETFQWLLVPVQSGSSAPITWDFVKLAGSDGLVHRVLKKLKSTESMVSVLGASILRKQLDDIPLWRGDYTEVRQLIDDFAQYLYLQRVEGPEVLLESIRSGVALLTWEADGFAYAEGFDEKEKRYRGLKVGERILLTDSGPGVIVKSSVARQQLANEVRPTATAAQPSIEPTPTKGGAQPSGTAAKSPRPKRFHGTVKLDPNRTGLEASRIAEEVIAHLVGQVGASVKVTLEIEADLPSGASEQTVRTVTENARTLKFDSHGFERE